jgi:hypothetical protein
MNADGYLCMYLRSRMPNNKKGELFTVALEGDHLVI